MAKCDRCQGNFDVKTLSRVYYYKHDKRFSLCNCCYNFIRQRFDDVIEEYILRKE